MMDDNIKRMLDSNKKNKASEEEAERLRQSELDQQAKGRQKLDVRSRELISLLRAVIDGFNSQSTPSDQIEQSAELTRLIQSKPHRVVVYTLPRKKNEMTLTFFNLEQPLNLSRENQGFVPIYAHLIDKRGKGLNFFWSEQSLGSEEGKWIACGISPRDSKGIIGFSSEFELRVLQEGRTSFPLFRATYSNDVLKEFSDALARAMEQED